MEMARVPARLSGKEAESHGCSPVGAWGRTQKGANEDNVDHHQMTLPTMLGTLTKAYASP